MKIREPEVICKNGKPIAVILPLAEYQELREKAEDAEDLEWLLKTRKEGVSYRPFSASEKGQV